MGNNTVFWSSFQLQFKFAYLKTKSHIVSVYGVPQMPGVGRADDLLYFKCLADAVPCERRKIFTTLQ